MVSYLLIINSFYSSLMETVSKVSNRCQPELVEGDSASQIRFRQAQPDRHSTFETASLISRASCRNRTNDLLITRKLITSDIQLFTINGLHLGYSKDSFFIAKSHLEQLHG